MKVNLRLSALTVVVAFGVAACGASVTYTSGQEQAFTDALSINPINKATFIDGPSPGKALEWGKAACERFHSGWSITQLEDDDRARDGASGFTALYVAAASYLCPQEYHPKDGT